MNFSFNSSGKIWNFSLNLSFLHPHATISTNNSNATTSVRIPLVDSTIRNNLCHPSFDSNVKYESNNITASSSRQYHAGILIFGSTRTVIRKRSPCLPHKRDRWPAAEWKQYGSVVRGRVRADYRKIFGNIRKYASIIISIRTLSLNAKACFVLQTTFVSLSILFSFKYISFQIGLTSIHRFINKSLSCK